MCHGAKREQPVANVGVAPARQPDEPRRHQIGGTVRLRQPGAWIQVDHGVPLAYPLAGFGAMTVAENDVPARAGDRKKKGERIT